MEVSAAAWKSLDGSGLPGKITFAKRPRGLKVWTFCAGKNADRSSFFSLSRIGNPAKFHVAETAVKRKVFRYRGLF